MDALLEFICKSTGVLLLFVIVYQLLLKRLTFFNANRWFLLAGLLASVVFPFIEITQTVYVEAPQEVFVQEEIATPMAFILEQQPIETPQIEPEPTIDLRLLAMYGYLAVVLFFLGKMAVELASLVKLIRSGAREKRGGFVFVSLSRKLTPFSFFNYICYSEQEKNHEELALIIDHEKVHARQWHSVDLLLSHLYRAFFWWNPLAWIAKKQIGENLEFIADAVAKRQHAHGHTYERALLSRAASHMQPALANNFFTPFIKQRIVMLQKEASATWNAYKYALILPVMLVFIYSFNRVQEIEYVEKETVAPITNNEAVERELLNNILLDFDEKASVQNDELIFDITKTTTEAQLKKYEQQINAQSKYKFRFENVKLDDNGKLQSMQLATKFEGKGWHTNLTVSFNDSSLWLLIATPYELKLNDDDKEESVIISSKGNKLVQEDLLLIDTTVINNYSVQTNNDSITRNSKSNTVIVNGQATALNTDSSVIVTGYKTSDIKTSKDYENLTIKATMSREEVEKIVGRANKISSASLKLVTLKYKKDKIIKIKLRRQANGSKSEIVHESTGEIKNICILATEKDITIKSCSETIVLQNMDGSGFVLPAMNDKKVDYTQYMNGKSQPVVVLDGKTIPYEKLDAVDADQIESVTVLKGNDATSLYGDKGKNGVILITTKKEEEGLTYLFPKKKSSVSTPIVTSKVVMTTLESNMSQEELSSAIKSINQRSLDEIILEKVTIKNKLITELEMSIQDGVTDPKKFAIKNEDGIAPVIITVTNGTLEIVPNGAIEIKTKEQPNEKQNQKERFKGTYSINNNMSFQYLTDKDITVIEGKEELYKLSIKNYDREYIDIETDAENLRSIAGRLGALGLNFEVSSVQRNTLGQIKNINVKVNGKTYKAESSNGIEPIVFHINHKDGTVSIKQ